MSKSTSSSSALRFTCAAVRILIILNWATGVAIFTLLAVLPTRQWIMTALKLSPSLEADRLIMGMQAIAVIGLIGTVLNYSILRRLFAILETVQTGNPFVAANADRLHGIARALLILQILSLVVAAIAKAVSTPALPLHLDAGFSVNGWLAVFLTFVLAHVFAVGTAMREDLEGTV